MGIQARRPAQVITRLRYSLDRPVTHPNLATLTGKAALDGRINLWLALHPLWPFPRVPAWFDETFRLPSIPTDPTHDLDFVDLDMDGQIDHLIEVSGDVTDQVYPVRLYAFDPATMQFEDVTRSTIGDVQGNFQKVAAGDFDDDGCADLVFASFLKADPNPAVPELPFQGASNRLLMQVRTGGVCTLTFVDLSTRIHPRWDVTRDVDVLDANNDGCPDILFGNAYTPTFHGGDYNDQLLINFKFAGQCTGLFFDDTHPRLPDLPATDVHNVQIESCDLDGDGSLDIVEVGTGDIKRILMNDGTGHFSEELFRLIDDIDGTHDVACADLVGANGGDPDGAVDLVFAVRRKLFVTPREPAKNKLFVNDGNGYFTNMSHLLPDVEDFSNKVAVCDLDGQGRLEIIFGNGDSDAEISFESRVLSFNAGKFEDAGGQALGFDFREIRSVTEDVECADLDGDQIADLVVFGNEGMRNWLYRRQ